MGRTTDESSRTPNILIGIKTYKNSTDLINTSNDPPLRTNACEQTYIMMSMIKSAKPVGFATPPIIPKSPGLSVNSHSFTVKFLAFSTGSFTTIIAGNLIFYCVIWLKLVCCS